MELPSLRRVLTELLADTEKIKGHAGSDPPVQDGSNVQPSSLDIKYLPPKVERTLIALHQIYPHHLLSSLDLLDNGLATRFVLSSPFPSASDISARIYYVRSSQTRSSRFVAPTSLSVYEVRPQAWHCTCASFTFSAFSSRQNFIPFENDDDSESGSERWGGEMRGEQPAICKHLLAVVIGERLGVIPTREVDMDTLANYAIGMHEYISRKA